MADKIDTIVSNLSDSDTSRLAHQDLSEKREANSPSTEDLPPISDPKSPFSDPDVAAHYASLYEKAQYECRHAFDLTLQ